MFHSFQVLVHLQPIKVVAIENISINFYIVMFEKITHCAETAD